MRSAVLRGLALLGIWPYLTMEAIDGMAFGLVAVVGATALSLCVLPRSRAAIDGRRLPGLNRVLRPCLPGRRR